MKSYTDLEQSKRLVEILPIETADMWFQHIGDSFKDGITRPLYFPMVIRDNPSEKDIPCWSLVALLSVIRKTTGYTLHGVNNVYISCELGDFRKIETEVYENEVDACVEMITKLHELKML